MDTIDILIQKLNAIHCGTFFTAEESNEIAKQLELESE